MSESKLTTMLLADAIEKYSDDQPRDDNGRWGEGGSGRREESHSIKSSGDANAIHQSLKEAGFKSSGIHDRGHGTAAQLIRSYSHPNGHTAKIVTTGGRSSQKGHATINADFATHAKFKDAADRKGYEG